MTARPPTIRRARPGDAAALGRGGCAPMTARVLLGELNGAPLAIVAVDGGSPPADHVARAELAVRVLVMYRGQAIGDATLDVPAPGPS
jgi:hypothetical protein